VNPEYLALVKIGALLEREVPGTVFNLEKLVGEGSFTELVEKTFNIHVHNGESAYAVLQRIEGKCAKNQGSDSSNTDPYIDTFS